MVDASPMDIESPAGAYRIKGALGTEDFSMDSVLGLVSDVKRKLVPTARRCVIDSVSSLLFQFEKPFDQRQQLLRLIKGLTEMRLTTIMLGEIHEGSIDFQRFGSEAYLTQGVFVMHNVRSKNLMSKVFQIKKLRGQKFPKTMMPYSIGKNGVEVHLEEKVFV